MSNAREIAEKILNCKTYDIPDIKSVARAYLELENKVDVSKQRDRFASKIADLETEITKLKEENEKLKKSREGLRKAVEFYGSEDSWNWSDWNRDLMSNFEDGELKEFEDKHDNHFLAGKKAREAIKSDDDIMGG